MNSARGYVLIQTSCSRQIGSADRPYFSAPSITRSPWEFLYPIVSSLLSKRTFRCDVLAIRVGTYHPSVAVCRLPHISGSWHRASGGRRYEAWPRRLCSSRLGLV